MKQQNPPLVLEQLEDRIFLDANPLVVADGAHDPTVEPTVEVPVEASVEPVVVEPVAVEPENIQHLPDNSEGDSAEAISDDGVIEGAAAENEEVPEQEGVVATQDGETESADEANLETQADGIDDSANQESNVAEQGGTEELSATQESQDVSDESASDLNVASDSVESATSETEAIVTDPVPIDPMIGEDFNFTVSFDNTTGSDVFGPYIDLLLEGGQDGSDAANDDGITFQSATYLGANVESTVIDITVDGQTVIHPWATDASGNPLEITGINGQAFRAGDQFVSLLMPFGSFTPDQPVADVQITAHMGVNADVDEPLDVLSTTGAMFGHDALDNPGTDAPLRDIVQTTTAYVPEVITYRKDIIVPNVAADCQEQHDPAFDDVRQWADDTGQEFERNHQEIPTGPNYPATYVATIDIADGQTVTDLSLVEHLPDNIYYLGDATVTVTVGGVVLGAGDYTITSPGEGVHGGQDLEIQLNNNALGGAGNQDVVITYDFYVPEVLDANSGDDGHVINDGEVTYSWTPVDPNDAAVVDATIDPEVNADGHFSFNPNVDDISHSQSIAIQKNHTSAQSGDRPGNTLDYTLDFQLSDYFSFGDQDVGDGDTSFRIDDVVADGLLLHETAPGSGIYVATVEIWENGNHYTANLTSTANPGDAMWTTIGTADDPDDVVVHYNMQQILADMGVANGILQGDLVDGNQDGPTHGRITYSADIAQQYVSEDGSDTDVDQGDIINGGVTITGDIYTAGAFNGQSEADESCDSFQIVTGGVHKDIYAVTRNGTTDYAPGVNPHLSPGDTVTYRITYDMPISSTESFKLIDYLPLPVFDVNDPDQDGAASGWTFDNTFYDGTNGTGTPVAGHWGYTDVDTYHTLDTPDTVTAGAGNTLIFDYGTHHDNNDTQATIELVFTVTISDEPFADNMFLTNQVRATEAGTSLDENNTDAIIQIVLDEPDLHITKGVVETDNNVADSTTPTFSANAGVDGLFTEPGSAGFRTEGGVTISSDWLAIHDINTNLNNSDAGDTVTMAIIVENTGHSGAYDVALNDVLPAGYGLASNIHITDGANNPVHWTGASGNDIASDLFTVTGIIIDDAGGTAGLAEYNNASGANILVITYDVQLQSSVYSHENITNTATLTHYAGAEDATDHTTEDVFDTAVVTTTSPDVDKSLVSTEIVNGTNANNEAVIGEMVTYSVEFTLPEGHADNVQIVDTLDAGLTFGQLTDIASSSGDLTSSKGAFDLANYSGVAAGQTVIFDLGDLVNLNTENTTSEVITLTYTAFVNNSAGNQSGTLLNNSAVAHFDDSIGTTFDSNIDSAENVTVIEPDLDVEKSVVVGGAGTTGDAGGSVEYTITIRHNGGSETDAFDVTFSDQIPAEIVGASITSVVDNDGTPLGTGDFTLSPTNLLTLNGNIDIPESRIITITVTGTLAASVFPGQSIVNDANVQWQSLDNDVPHNQDSTTGNNERTGVDGAGGLNNYTDTGSAEISVTTVTVDKTLSSTGINNAINGAADVVIGEEATYQVIVTVPEGVLDGAELVDTLEEGLAIQRIELKNASGGLVTDLAGGFAAVSYSTSGTGAAGDAQTITFDLGNLTNTDDNGGLETFTIQYTVLVLDNYGSADGQALTNSAQLNYSDGNGGIESSDPGSVDVDVIEPWISTVKTVDQTSGVEEGDVLTYTVALTNGGNATAYEVNFNDTLAPGTTFGAVQSATISGVGDVSVGTTASAAGGVVTFSNDIWDVDPTAVLTVTYTVTVNSAILVDGTHTNTVDADWSSLDGTDADERVYDEDDGIDSPVDDGVNADRDVDTAVFSMDPPTITKSDGGVTEATIGETITYTLTINSPQGTIANFTVEDILSEGLIFNNDAVISTASGSFSIEAGHSEDPSFTLNDGSAAVTISWDLGDTIIDTDDPILITYTATVANVAANFLGEDLGNTASIEYDNAQGVHETPVEVTDGLTVIEPWISTVKTVDQTSGVEEGDVLTYTVALTNGGNATAYEVNFNDTLAPGTTFGAVQSATISGVGDVSVGTTASAAGGVVTFSNDIWDVDPTAVLTVTYTVTVNSAILVDGTHTNTVDADWSSLDGTDADERVYDEDDGIDSPVDDGVNADRDVDTAVFSMDPPTITKSDGGVTTATIGDTITYTLTINSPQGTIDNFVIEDVLSAGLIFNNDAVFSTASGNYTIEAGHTENTSFSGSNDGSANVTLTWDLGDTIINTDSPILITYTATVANVTTNFLGENLGNTASIEYDNAQGVHQTPPAVTDGLTVVEPQITTIKDVSAPADPAVGVLPGEVLTYTVVLENTGTSTAYEVTAFDTLPTGVRLDTGTAPTATYGNASNATISITDNGDGTLSFDSAVPGNWDIAVGDTITITYTIEVVGAGFVVGSHTNVIDADWSGRDGAPAPGAFERVYDDGDTQPVHSVDGSQDDDPASFDVLSNPPSLGDFIWFDQNGDGQQDANEPGITGVVVNLFADTDGDGAWDATPLATATTDADGEYSFANLPLTTFTIPYKVVVDSSTLPGGMVQTWENSTYNSTTGYPDNDLNGQSIVDVLDTANNILDVDFGYRGINSVGDTVWFDVDGDGVQDDGTAGSPLEDGIGGLIVSLTGDIDGDGIDEYTAANPLTTTTDENGHYSFDHLPAGDFDITVTPAAGTTPTYDEDGRILTPDNTTPFSLGADEDRDDIDFGLRGTGSIGDFVWYDADGLGDQNEGAVAGIGGVTVTLSGDIDGDGSIDYTTTTTTAADGSYLFDNLLGGNYTITVDDATLPDGMTQTFDLDDGTGPFGTANASAVVLAPGTDRTAVDFGYTGTTSVGDTVWYDVNNDGIQNPGEVGLNNVSVTISADIDGDGVAEYTETVLTGVDPLTGNDGFYQFTDLPEGDYTITVAPPAGSIQTYDQDDGLGAVDNEAIFTMDGVNDREDIDFGYRGAGSIGDFVWYDADFDGVQNDGALSGIGGVTVELSGDIDGDGTIDYTITTTTNADGSYLFDNLLGGTYTITVDDSTLPDGAPNWHQTYDLDDGTGAFATAHSSGDVDLAINGAALNRTDVDFGYTGNGSIGDLVFFDKDYSGDLSVGDTGITGIGVTLTADVNGDGTVDYTWHTTTSNVPGSEGQYLFENLPAFDNYVVTIDPANLPPNAEQSFDLDGVTPEHVTSGINLNVAEDRTDVDFGYITAGTGSIGDTVWYDANNDGIEDASEVGLAGVELTLSGDITGDGVDDVFFTTTTDANGQYSFDELLAGDYTVTVTSVPAGMSQTFDLDGLGTPDEASIALADGEQNNNVDFGYTGAANIGDTIYYDADNSGSETAGDVGLGGVTVTLTGDVNNDGIDDVLTTVTDANGHYLFENLRDGDYVITVDPAGLPGGMDQSADPDGVLDNTSDVTLAGGVDDLDQDFGYTGTGTIGDRIWNDLDGDGNQDAGEAGINGIDVTISVDFDGDGTVDYTETVTTAGDGNYTFDNLPAGTYSISVDTTDPLLTNSILTGDPDSNLDSSSTVILPAGGTNLDQDFGYRDTGAPTGSIGDTIYFDADHSGSETGADVGLGGVTVTLTGDIDGDGDIDTVTTTTAADGTYLFDNLVAGDYTVAVDPSTLPAGMNNTVDPDGGNDNTVDVTIGGANPLDNTDQDFGYDGTGSIGDTIYFDGNNNGNQDAGEGGIAGVDVRLDLDLDGDGTTDFTQTTTTLADGSYLFEDLPAGDYTITVDPATLPNGMQQSADPDSSLDNTSTVNLAGGQNDLDQDFGYTGTGSIGDTIWNDVDGDGTQNGTEAGLPNVDVTLNADIDGDGNPDYTVTVTTDADGNYVFENLPAGDYTITIDPNTLPAGMNPVTDPDGGNDNTADVTLVAGEDNLDQDFGYNSGTGSIGDTIFFDENGDGTQNGTEGGLAGVTVTLTGDVDGNGTIDTLTAVTDANGHYLFENLAAGDYNVTVDQASLPAGMAQTSADPDSPAAPDNTSSVNLANGENNTLQDFGYRGTGSIGDTIWDDANGDGLQNDGAGSVLPGVDVTLSVDFDGDGVVDYTMTETTDANGNYSFDNLPAGEYTIAVDTADIPAGYVLTGDPDSNPDSTSVVNLGVGETNQDQDFGYHDTGNPTGSIGDTIWFDSNGDGVQNDGPLSGLGGVTVTLTGDIDGDGVIDTITTVTDSSGAYLFDNLTQGDYTVTVDPASLPAGMTNTADPDGGNDNTADVTIGGGNPLDNSDQDFGYNGTGGIGDTIYFDTDGDGVQDPGENGMPGVDVTISVDLDGDGNPDFTSTTTTDGNGHYNFDNLPAGAYTITVSSLPVDVVPTGDPDGTADSTTVLDLGPGEINNDQDFGYTGSGSIGDTIYFDADGNGFQSSGEPGLGGVTVTLQGDFDNDGTIDSVTTVTDANGHYLFEGLTAGNYTVYVDTNTVPSALTQTGDPDAILNDQSTVVLGAGVNNMDQDFGYGGISPFITPIPKPEIPPAEPIVPTVPSTRVTPFPVQAEAPTEPGIIPDAFFMNRQFGDQTDDDIFFYPFDEIPWLEPLLPVSPIYTGHAEPGTTLEFVLYDAMGNQIAYQTVMADTAGNWLASFQGTMMFDHPHHMEIHQTASTYNSSTAGFFNMRVFYNPNFSSMVFSSATLDVGTIFAHLPSTIMDSIHMGNMSPLNLGWNDFDGYEFLAPSTHPANSGH